MQTHNRTLESPIAAISVLCILLGALWYFVPHPVVIIAAGLLPMATLLVFKLPFPMVLLFVIFSFFRLHEVFPVLMPLKIPLLLSLASLTALAWHVGISQKIKPYWREELTILSGFFLLVIVGVVMARNPAIAMTYFSNIYWKIALMTFAIAWLTRNERDFSLASLVITVSGLLVSLVALYNKANAIGLVEGTRVTIGRAIGSVLGDPNDLALVLMFPISFALSLALNNKLGRTSRWLGYICVPVLFSAVVATQSRGGLLGILAVCGVFAYRRIRSKTLFLVLGLFAALLLYFAAGISGRASGGAAEAGIDASAQGRLYAWEAAFGMAIDNPLTGVGLDNFYANYFYYSPHWDGLNHAVHSTWFGVLAETGFLGLGVFVAMIILLIKTTLRCLTRIEAQPEVNATLQACTQAVLAGLIGTAISGTFLTQGFTWPIYILAALVVAIAHWTDNHLDKPGDFSNSKETSLCTR